MKVFIEPAEYDDLAVGRIINALKLYAPSYVNFVDERYDAELVVMQINGRLDRTKKRIDMHNTKGIAYVIIQYCVKSTLNIDVIDWIPIWEGAKFAWSYLDLPALAKQEDCVFPTEFYHAPLGVDSNIFKPQNIEKKYLVLVASHNYLSECARETIMAAHRVGGAVAHLGEELGKPGIDNYYNITDDELVGLYNQCYYITGLRRTEGFELPAAEGLLCKARPIVFDVPHYKNWYDEFAVFIPETHRAQIIDDLEIIFKSPYNPVEMEEIYKARELFNWRTIIEGFWAWL